MVGIAVLFQCGNATNQGSAVGNATPQARGLDEVERDFGPIQPPGMLGGMLPFSNRRAAAGGNTVSSVESA